MIYPRMVLKYFGFKSANVATLSLPFKERSNGTRCIYYCHFFNFLIVYELSQNRLGSRLTKK